MSAIVEAGRVLGIETEGRALRVDGHVLRPRLTAKALQAIEARFGSLDEPEVPRKVNRELHHVACELIALALQHERVEGQPITAEWLHDRGDIAQIWAMVPQVIQQLITYCAHIREALRADRTLEAELQRYASAGLNPPAG